VHEIAKHPSTTLLNYYYKMQRGIGGLLLEHTNIVTKQQHI